MNGSGKRLKEERQRLGLTQEEFANLGGVKKLAQANYEAEKRYPNTLYLANIWLEDVDIQYILTGVREVNLESKSDTDKASQQEKEQRFLQAYNRVLTSAAALDIVWGKVLLEIVQEVAEHPEIHDAQIGAKLEVRRKFIKENIEGKDK